MNSEKEALLVKGPVGITLVKLTIPMIFGILGMMIFNIADTFYIGKIGHLELAAFSFTFPVVMSIASIAIGIGMGTSAVVSRAVGERNIKKAKRLTTDSLLLAFILVSIVTAIGIFTINPLFRLLGADSKTLPFVREYMRIWYPGMIFVVAPMVGNNVIRAIGDTKTPGIIMLIAGILNFILDPILIFGIGPFPEMGLAGAALATVITRAITLCVAFWVLYFREKLLLLAVPPIKFILKSWKQILYIGIPVSFTRIIMPVTTGVITRVIAVYGPEAIAGFGVSCRIEFFCMAVVVALSSVIGPFIGQNKGAGNIDRLKRSIYLSYRFSMIWGISMFVIMLIFAEFIASLFSNNQDVIAACATYLRIVPVCYAMFGVLIVAVTAMNVLNRPFSAALIIFIQMLVIYIPLAYIGSLIFGIAGIFSAKALGYIIAGIFAYFVLKRVIILCKDECQ